MKDYSHVFKHSMTSSIANAARWLIEHKKCKKINRENDGHCAVACLDHQETLFYDEFKIQTKKRRKKKK